MYIILLLTGLISIFQSDARGQTTEKRLSEARRQLSAIREEISILEHELESTEKKLRSEISMAENLDRQMTLVRKAIRILQAVIQRKKGRIIQLNERIDSLKTQIQTLREIFRQQIVFAYKYQRGKELAWILGSQSFNQALLRYRYFQRISVSARHIYERLQTKHKQLQEIQDKLFTEVNEQKKLVTEKQTEQNSLDRKRLGKKLIIDKISSDKTLLAQALEEKKKNYMELEKLIATLERERKTRRLAPQTQIRWERLAGDFARQRGNLNWPVTGKILHPFGKYKNPHLKTVLLNTGIDILARKGTNVHCVFPGIVSLITYMSGFGNTIILDHNNGYYTVYTHLDEILVTKSQFVESGQVIGTVGDSGSLEGSLLHFEIYGGNQPLNPMEWLKKF